MKQISGCTGETAGPTRQRLLWSDTTGQQRRKVHHFVFEIRPSDDLRLTYDTTCVTKVQVHVRSSTSVLKCTKDLCVAGVSRIESLFYAFQRRSVILAVVPD